MKRELQSKNKVAQYWEAMERSSRETDSSVSSFLKWVYWNASLG